METVVIPVHSFASCMGYCQYITINRFHRKLVPEIKEAQIAGQALHTRLDELDRLVPRREATAEELLDKSVDLDIPRESLRVAIRRVNSNEFIYLGRMDKVVREKGDIIIIDDKTTKRRAVSRQLFLDRTLQLSSYCEGFTRNYSGSVKFDRIFFKVVQRDQDNGIIFESTREYDNSMQNLLRHNFEVFESVYNKAVRPMHHNNPNKCRACSFLKDCEWRLS